MVSKGVFNIRGMGLYGILYAIYSSYAVNIIYNYMYILIWLYGLHDMAFIDGLPTGMKWDSCLGT
jgi:hypothetical protein